MQSIRFGKDGIVVTYHDEKRRMMDEKFIEESYFCQNTTCDGNGNVLTIVNNNNNKFTNTGLFFIVLKLLKHSVNNGDFYTEHDLIDRTLNGRYHVYERFQAITKNNKLFRMSVDGSPLGFGIWQYGRILKIENFNGVEVSIRNSNIEDTYPTIPFDDVESVLVEIGEIQF